MDLLASSRSEWFGQDGHCSHRKYLCTARRLATLSKQCYENEILHFLWRCSALFLSRHFHDCRCNCICFHGLFLENQPSCFYDCFWDSKAFGKTIDLVILILVLQITIATSERTFSELRWLQSFYLWTMRRRGTNCFSSTSIQRARIEIVCLHSWSSRFGEIFFLLSYNMVKHT